MDEVREHRGLGSVVGYRSDLFVVEEKDGRGGGLRVGEGGVGLGEGLDGGVAEGRRVEGESAVSLEAWV